MIESSGKDGDGSSYLLDCAYFFRRSECPLSKRILCRWWGGWWIWALYSWKGNHKQSAVIHMSGWRRKPFLFWYS